MPLLDCAMKEKQLDKEALPRIPINELSRMPSCINFPEVIWSSAKSSNYSDITIFFEVSDSSINSSW